ncbi:MAG: hypothetical protein AAF230_07920 [Pseudomonadota bacterium]
MKYDFDMISVTPDEFQTKYATLLSVFRLTDQAAEKLAMFRDPLASWALAGASQEIRDSFVASGFALNCRQTNDRAGEYAAKSKDSRAEVLERLRQNVDALPRDLNWNGFDIDVFFAEAHAATPATETQKSLGAIRSTVIPPIELLPTDRVRSRALSTPAAGF